MEDSAVDSEPSPLSEVDKLRITANHPEVHAAAILAAKDYLLTQGGLRDVKSDRVVQAIGFHAALIFRWYLTYLDPAISDEVFHGSQSPSRGD